MSRPSEKHPNIHFVRRHRVQGILTYSGHWRWHVWTPNNQIAGLFEDWTLALHCANRLSAPPPWRERAPGDLVVRT